MNESCTCLEQRMLWSRTNKVIHMNIHSRHSTLRLYLRDFIKTCARLLDYFVCVCVCFLCVCVCVRVCTCAYVSHPLVRREVHMSLMLCRHDMQKYTARQNDMCCYHHFLSLSASTCVTPCIHASGGLRKKEIMITAHIARSAYLDDMHFLRDSTAFTHPRCTPPDCALLMH